MQDRDTIERQLKQCLKESAGGDRAAFKTIYKLTAPTFNAIILNMVRDQDITNDILQRAYMSIWKSASTYSPDKGKAFTWMLVVTRNRAIDVIRERRRLSPAEDLCETLEDESAQTDETAKSFLLRELIYPHLVKLPEHISEAIILNVVYGYTSREIGERMDVSTNTAKSWIRRGLKTLRDNIPSEELATLL